MVDVDEEDCFVMSLVENLARRQHTTLELVSEIGALKQRGYSIQEIATKTDFSPEYIYAICYLLETGEERLINGVERGIIPITSPWRSSRPRRATCKKPWPKPTKRRRSPEIS